MFLRLQDINEEVEALLAARRWDDALSRIMSVVQGTFRAPEVRHRFLYYPWFDEYLRILSLALQSSEGEVEYVRSDVTLIIATELYPVGGHSRVVEDIVDNAPSTVVVLTDALGRYARDPRSMDWILRRFPSAFALPEGSLWAKCRMLYLLCRELRPRNVFYFNHHEDPVPFVATLSIASAKKTLFHHCDHDPSLGPTLKGVSHVDFSLDIAKHCSACLGAPIRVLPLYVDDRGAKPLLEDGADQLSVVASGTPVKFARHGEVALKRLVGAALGAVKGRFYHIGPLPDEWRAEIVDWLDALGIDRARFVPLGVVPSLWEALLQLGADFYIGSAPVGGGRAAVEAQGCGYPVLFYNGADPSTLLCNYSLYADSTLGWGSPDELADLLRVAALRRAALSREARVHYERYFSKAEFLRVLDDVLGD